MTQTDDTFTSPAINNDPIRNAAVPTIANTVVKIATTDNTHCFLTSNSNLISLGSHIDLNLITGLINKYKKIKAVVTSNNPIVTPNNGDIDTLQLGYALTSYDTSPDIIWKMILNTCHNIKITAHIFNLNSEYFSAEFLNASWRRDINIKYRVSLNKA